MKKICFSILTIVILCSHVVYAGEIVGPGQNFLNRGTNQNINLDAATKGFQKLAGLLWGAGVFAIVIAGAIIGIKYMMGSVEEKAEHKKMLVPYIVGSVIILGALTIWQILIEILSVLEN